jgi:hypothetical protein
MGMNWYIFVIAILVVVSSGLNSYVFGSESFQIDTILKEGLKVGSKVHYHFPIPTDNTFNPSNSKAVCPSNDCVVKFNSPYDLLLSVDENSSYMSLQGYFRLQDNQTNGHFTPKKQNFVENMQIWFGCGFNDIIEVHGSTKYTCSVEDTGGIIARIFNSTISNYDYSASFELPSMHYVLNATEQ